MTTPKIGVLLFNLGGPETLDDVKPFLYNLFSDPDIIRINSAWLRKPVAWLIATTRQRKSRSFYAQIGGGSPLRRITEDQAAALRKRLAAEGCEVNVYVGMRCWPPTIDEALAAIERDAITHLIALPLFPQYSIATSGSCINYFSRKLRQSQRSNGLQVSFVTRWYDEPLYIEAMAELTRAEFAQFPDPNPQATYVVYSAHSIPNQYVAAGDPYLDHTRHTVELINARLGTKHAWTLAFQSKVGPVKWLEPSTESVLEALGRRHTPQVLIVPISFVSDHIETLYEIDIQYRHVAQSVGIAHFRRTAAPNVNPKFIGALTAIVKEQIAHVQPVSKAISG
jgi:ferrochelatase